MMPIETREARESPCELIQRYVRNGSQEAFAQLVKRYTRVVYGAALRRTGGIPHLAEDAAQIVFADLARRAPALADNERLGAWLHRRACRAAADLMKGELRRRRREAIAANLHTETCDEHTSSRDVAPVIDECLNRLKESDRAALIMRFLEGRSIREVSAALDIAEDAAQKRISRGTEKLRELLSKRGVALSTAFLVATLKTQGEAAVPPGLTERALRMGKRGSAGHAWLLWKWLPMAGSFAAGFLFVILMAVPLFSLSAPDFTSSSTGMQDAAVSSEPAAAAGLSVEEVVDRIVASVVEAHRRGGSQLKEMERLVLAASIPPERSRSALARFFAGLRKEQIPLRQDVVLRHLSFLKETWVRTILDESPDAVLEIFEIKTLDGISKREAWLDRISKLPRSNQTSLARQILDDPLCADELKFYAAMFYADGNRDCVPDLQRREELLKEAMDRMKSGGCRWWATAATRMIRTEAECVAVADCGIAVLTPGDASLLVLEVLDYWITRVESSRGFYHVDPAMPFPIRAINRYVERLPPALREMAALALFTAFKYPGKGINWMTHANWTLAQLSRPSALLPYLKEPVLIDPDTWCGWLEKNPEVITDEPEEMKKLIIAMHRRIDRKHWFQPGDEDRLARGRLAKTRRWMDPSALFSESLPGLTKPGPDGVQRLFYLWRRVDPAAVEASLQDPNFASGPLRGILQNLNSEKR